MPSRKIDLSIRSRQRDAAIRDRLRKLEELDRMEAEMTLNLLGAHLAAYFEATEERRAEAFREMQQAENKARVTSTTLPVGEWTTKWPPAARNAILALWRTPREG